jgi:sterol desaturase/sphingolipid hydroxylase (fatty acid hydroxylase superfamily)
MLQMTENLTTQTSVMLRVREGSLRALMGRRMRAIAASRSNYWLSYTIDFACPVVLGYLGLRHSIAAAVSVACFCTGVFVFSFVEYAMHRWFFHAPQSVAAAIHQAHHVHPREPSSLPCPSSAAVALTFWSLLSPVVGDQVACFFLCGLLVAYFYYAVLHHLQHSIRIKTVPLRWLQKRWAAHAVHHGRTDTNFGVTTAFWDHVFGTHHASRRRK